MFAPWCVFYFPEGVPKRSWQGPAGHIYACSRVAKRGLSCCLNIYTYVYIYLHIFIQTSMYTYNVHATYVYSIYRLMHLHMQYLKPWQGLCALGVRLQHTKSPALRRLRGLDFLHAWRCHLFVLCVVFVCVCRRTALTSLLQLSLLPLS